AGVSAPRAGEGDSRVRSVRQARGGGPEGNAVHGAGQARGDRRRAQAALRRRGHRRGRPDDRGGNARAADRGGGGTVRARFILAAGAAALLAAGAGAWSAAPGSAAARVHQRRPLRVLSSSIVQNAQRLNWRVEMATPFSPRAL